MANLFECVASIGGGGEEVELLWINPNPTQSFSAQTISLDLTDYEGIIVKSCYEPTNSGNKDYFGYAYIIKGNADVAQNHTLSTKADGFNSVSRSCSVTNSGVTFELGQSGGSTRNANYCVPVEIWGVPLGSIKPKYIGDAGILATATSGTGENCSISIPAKTSGKLSIIYQFWDSGSAYLTTTFDEGITHTQEQDLLANRYSDRQTRCVIYSIENNTNSALNVAITSASQGKSIIATYIGKNL